MKIRNWFAIASGTALLAAAGIPAVAQDAADGLVRASSARFDQVYLRPGTDFRGYTKVMFDPAAQVTFSRDWQRDLNNQKIAVLQGTSDQDAADIAAKYRAGFSEAFTGSFSRAGYEIAAAPGKDVLAVSIRLADVWINAPETVTLALPSRTYTYNAGYATLVLELRDSTTGTLLARVTDRRTAGDRGAFATSFRNTTPVSDDFNFSRMFGMWAGDSVKSLRDLKARSPVS
ncbi:MAG TPA: DUF3313 family protein [Casimicrobiaceae bacterium]|nr:DUF3313 family protein [Casimicrobiaceae bacterium]